MVTNDNIKFFPYDKIDTQIVKKPLGNFLPFVKVIFYIGGALFFVLIAYDIFYFRRFWRASAKEKEGDVEYATQLSELQRK
jgi:hypothetical protein